MALSKRLLAIYHMVERGSVAADIGCDHAQLSIALVQNDICSHVYACDLREQPLQRATEAIQAVHLQNQITPCLKNGIAQLSPEVSTIVIAGMGVETALMILSDHPEELQEHRTFIIQVNRHVDTLRSWISEHHYTILKEALVEEDHFYEIVCFRCQYHDAYSEEEQLFGVYMKNEPLYERYLKHRLAQLEFILAQLPSEHQRRMHMERLQQMILKQLYQTHIKTVLNEDS